MAGGQAAYLFDGADIDGGARITQVRSGSAAASAGLRTGDVITAVDGQAVSAAGDVVERISALSAGDSVTLTVQRNGASITVHATLGSTG